MATLITGIHSLISVFALLSLFLGTSLIALHWIESSQRVWSFIGINIHVPLVLNLSILHVTSPVFQNTVYDMRQFPCHRDYRYLVRGFRIVAAFYPAIELA